ncbi:MAG: DUF1934 domain-containing protein [Oscillospiraceae bacterium]|nr:DUF1934 domain-containing protein [Oscillospiraceae bacterium]
MKEKEVIIELHSLTDCDREDGDVLDFSTDGMYSFENGRARLWYWETELTGLPGTRTSLEIGPEGVTVDRVGAVTSRMEFKEGSRNYFPFETPFGLTQLGMNTQRVDTAFNEHGGRAELDYVLDLQHAVASRNKLRISVRES